MQQKASEVKPISFAIGRVITVKDSLRPNTHLFLIPEDGSSDLIKLHDILYTDLLSSQLRLDIPFVPHITIGNTSDPESLQKVIEDRNARNLSIKGTIDTLDVLQYDGQEVKTLERIKLGK